MTEKEILTEAYKMAYNTQIIAIELKAHKQGILTGLLIVGKMAGNVGGMVSCRLRAAFLSNYTELQAGGNA